MCAPLQHMHILPPSVSPASGWFVATDERASERRYLKPVAYIGGHCCWCAFIFKIFLLSFQWDLGRETSQKLPPPPFFKLKKFSVPSGSVVVLFIQESLACAGPLRLREGVNVCVGSLWLPGTAPQAAPTCRVSRLASHLQTPPATLSPALPSPVLGVWPSPSLREPASCLLCPT